MGVIKSLSGSSPDSLAPNEAIVHNGKYITSNAKKADTFAKHYADVSKLSFSKAEREKHKLLKRKLTTQTAEE